MKQGAAKPYEKAAVDLSPTTQRNVLTVLRMLRPHAVRGFGKIRIGRAHDGGYVMIDDLATIGAAYSLGIADEVSWDLQMAKRGIDVYQYDHTIETPPVPHPRLHWFKTGIAGKRTPGESLDTLANVIEANGHQSRGDMVLQCDIEGYEYDMLANTDPAALARFKQIVIETHFFDRLADPKFATTAKRAFRHLTTNHKVVHVHANNFVGFTSNGGVAIPQVLEFTLARISDYELEPSHETFPTKLDSPNNAEAIDLQLGMFTY